MNEKDLMNGMTHVDDDLIEEASRPVVKKGFYLPRAMAAGLAAAVGVGAAFGGSTLVSQKKEIASLESQVAEIQVEKKDKEVSEGNQSVGVAGVQTLGRSYTAAGTYGKVYDVIAENFTASNDIAYAEYETEAAAAEAVEEDLDVAVDASAADSSGASGDYSSTNVMTEGVDESDIVKTDGSYIYMVQSGSVRIDDISAGGAPSQGTTLTVPFRSPADTIEEMYVDDGYLTLITCHAEEQEDTESASGYYNWYYGYDMETWVYVYDLTDPMNPVLVDDMYQDGTYETSRKVGDILYLFTTENVQRSDLDKEEALQEENISEWIPSVNDVPVDADCIYISGNGYRELLVSSFRVTEPKETIDAKIIMDDYSEIYVGTSAIYLYSWQYLGDHPATELSRMAYADGIFTPGAGTLVNGSVEDSFALNEKDGNLRILTTDWSSSLSVNTLFILDEEMSCLGRIDEIARGEEIYAARFVGDMAYFITYHNTDPLFVADLSDPSNPVLLGNVEISGFSDYLHIWDDTHILGIGYETNENSDRLGIKLVMFDVTDPAQPVVENTAVIALDCEWCYSDSISGLYKAILASPSKNLIGFGYEYDTADSEEEWVSKYMYSLLSYNKETGFTEHLSAEMTYDDIRGYRGLYVGDWFYIAGNGEVRTFDMENDYQEIQ